MVLSSEKEGNNHYCSIQLMPTYVVRQLVTAALATPLWYLRSYAAPLAANPTTLPGSIWGVTAYSNPAKFASKRKNYRRFHSGLATQGLPLLTVEVAFPGQSFELQNDDADVLVQLRGEDCMWTREAQMNIGVQALPSDCDKVVLLDCDILFLDPLWIEKTAAALEKYTLVQPFSLNVDLPPDSRLEASRPVANNLPKASKSFLELASRRRYSSNCAYGRAWAVRRSVYCQHGWYPYNVLGGADRELLAAATDNPFDRVRLFNSRHHRKHAEEWRRLAAVPYRRGASYLPGVVAHLYHGSRRNRRYGGRVGTLLKCDYDPRKDIRMDANGLPRWDSNKPELHSYCYDYFAARQEDSC